MYSLGLKFTTTFPSEFYPVLTFFIACENIRFSSLFAAGDVSRNVLAAKSEEKRMFSQANFFYCLPNLQNLEKKGSLKAVLATTNVDTYVH